MQSGARSEPLEAGGLFFGESGGCLAMAAGV